MGRFDASLGIYGVGLTNEHAPNSQLVLVWFGLVWFGLVLSFVIRHSDGLFCWLLDYGGYVASVRSGPVGCGRVTVYGRCA